MARGKQQKVRSNDNESFVPVPVSVSLPEDLVMDIMVRLPGKTLAGFKCLSKFWYEFIESNYFKHNHFQHHSNLPPRLLVHHHHYHPFNHDDRLHFSVFPNAETLESDTYHPIKFPYPPDFPNHLKCSIIGPVNGLFLLHSGQNGYNHQKTCHAAAIFNPATGQFKKLVVPNSVSGSIQGSCSLNLGFGFDSTTNDFKVISFPDPKCSILDLLWVSVYSLANKSWTDIAYFISEEKQSLLWHECGGMYFNHGAFYWLFSDGNFTYSLLSFDMRNNVFDMIDGPDNPSLKEARFCHGYKNDSLLAMFLYPHSVKSVDLMVMRNDGCWEKHLRINTSFVRNEMDIPLGLWKDNQLLFQTFTNLLCLYDPKTNEVKELEIFNNIRTQSIQIFYYKENLVSINRRVRSIYQAKSTPNVMIFLWNGDGTQQQICGVLLSCNEIWTS